MYFWYFYIVFSHIKVESILYSCERRSRENIKNIEKFLKNNPSFSLEKIELKNSIVKENDTGVLDILPDEYNCDGFFIAKLRKMEE